MKLTSKISAILIAFIILISTFVLPANAASVNYSCTSVCGKKGDEVIISVEISSGVALWGTMVSLTYNSTELEYVSSEKGELVLSGSLNHNDSKIVFAGQLDTALSVNGGEIFTAKFKILKESGVAELTVVPSSLSGDHITEEGETVAVTSANGEVDILDYDTLVKISCAMYIPTNEQFVVGDIYEDGAIDGFDAIYFDLLLNGYVENEEETTTPITDLQYSVSSTSGKKGDVVTVNVEMSSGVPLWGTVVSLSFDSSELQYVSSSKGKLVAYGSLNASESKITFAGMLDTNLSIDGGTIFTVEFKILKDSGYSILTVTPSSASGDHITDDGESVSVGAVNGKVDIV